LFLTIVNRTFLDYIIHCVWIEPMVGMNTVVEWTLYQVVSDWKLYYIISLIMPYQTHKLQGWI